MLFLRFVLCCSDGRLVEGDQILAIDGQPLDSNISHEQAISILQKARGLVELIVARSAQGKREKKKEERVRLLCLPSLLNLLAYTAIHSTCLLCGLRLLALFLTLSLFFALPKLRAWLFNTLQFLHATDFHSV